MRKILLFALVIATSLITKASEPTMKYQLLVRDAMGNALTNSEVTLSVKIHEGTPQGEVVFSEEHTSTTTPAGVFYANIGERSGVSLAELNWTACDYFMETEIVRDGQAVNLGTQQLLSVPRACYAHSAGKLVLSSPSGQRWNVTIANDGTLSTQKIQ